MFRCIAAIKYGKLLLRAAMACPTATNRGVAGERPARKRVDLIALHENARCASALLKSMGNPHRLIVLCQLLGGERNVGELERLVGLSQSALSQHLARLRRDGLVKTRRQAQTIYYSLAGHEAEAVLATLYRLYCAEKPSVDAIAMPAPHALASAPSS
jgi:DNA-binding transcriptional ArsR family regulator